MAEARLILGDALEVLRDMEPGSVDAVVTDPPYAIVNRLGVQKRKDGTRRLQFDWDGPGIADVVLGGLRLSLALCKPTAALFVFCGMDMVCEMLAVARKAGFTVKPAAWVKKCPPPAMKGNWWPSAFELAFYGYRNRPWFGDTDTKRCNVFVADSYRHGQPGKVAHPTQKPLKLMTRIVRSVVPPGGLCLDPFAGSGTTGIACLETGRDFIGVEINEAYHAVALRRLEGVQPCPSA